jgi:N-acetylneuraminic acid mutarotase
MGGSDGSAGLDKRLTAVEIYNPATDTWKKGADMPAPRSQFATAVVGGKIYLFGGFSFVDRRGKLIEKTMAVVDVYDPAADAWEQKGKAPTARTRMGAAALNGKVYITGGFRNTGGGGDHLEIYDPATDTWQNGAKLIEARWLLTSAAVNGKVYIFGGFVKPRLLEVVEEYDPATNKWSKKADLPNPRQELSPSSPVVDGKVYVMGGNDLNNALGTVDVYDPAKNRWEKGKKLPTARQSLATVQVKGKIYAIGGDPLASGATVEEFTPDGWPFAVSPQGKLATAWGTIKTAD